MAEEVKTLEIVVDRTYKKDTYTIGTIYIDGQWFCNSLEDKDRGLDKDMKLSVIKNRKVYVKTAIPTGRYEVTIDIFSPKFSKYPFYMEVCNGFLPRLKNVPAYDGILFHVMDGVKGADLSYGCIGVGRNKIKGGLLEGKDYFKKLYAILVQAKKDGKKIFVTVK